MPPTPHAVQRTLPVPAYDPDAFPVAVAPSWQTAFLTMLPTIRGCIAFAFRRLRPDARIEAVQEALANATLAFARLATQGRSDRAFPTALARFAVAQVRDGRTVGSALSVRDVLSPAAQRLKRVRVERFERFDAHERDWRESVVQDPRTPIPDQVWFRIDFPQWLASLSTRDRRIAQALAVGDSTSTVAQRFSLSLARVSQLRREFHESWRQFHRESEAPANPPATHGAGVLSPRQPTNLQE